MNHRTTKQAFTLSELLVSLAVLGLIAAFAIPKVLTAVNDAGVKAVGKETISMVSSSFDSLRADSNGFIAKATTTADLVGKMNYVQLLTNGAAPYDGAASPYTSSAGNPVMVLHNGGIIQYAAADNFTHPSGDQGFVRFNIDPDGPGAAGAVSVNLGYDGRVWLADEAYGAGTGTAASGFNASYIADTGEIAATAPGNAVGSDTTWMNW